MPTLMLELASASPPNPLQCLACLCARTSLQMRLQHCPPIAALSTPYASAPAPHLLLSLQSLHSCGALKLVECLPNMPPMPLTILMLGECLPEMPPMLLTILMLAVPSQHASIAPLTLAQSSRPLMIFTLLQPPQDETMMLPPISALTTPYTSAPPPYLLCRALKICLQHHPQPPLPSLC
ncbi:hypothetical protein O181_096606 [Austropuccinia psidii MF-1]|uniref:Uncharacterized protein n=1 Tax=Austropuccinia psidii MF-1 TaxID=1389203 RepID=A0A9Q3J7R2_9BASI|nr:hypothetical protein [Austropuccinia psidii MF-1]